MDYASFRQEQEATLVAALRALWKQAYGVPAGDVRALTGPDSVAVWIEDVFSPAERALARSIEGQVVLQRYTGQLLAIIQPDLRAQVEAITGHRIVSGNVSADVDTGGVLCFFILGERLTSPPGVTAPNAASSP
jgi:uncharacterized protein YbcI